MVNWKTFLAGLALAICLNGESIGIPKKAANPMAAIAALALGVSAKDKDVTGVGPTAERK